MRFSSTAGLRTGLLTLIGLTVFTTVVLPLTRPTGRLYVPFGLTQMSLLTEAAHSNDTAPELPAKIDAPVTLTLLVLSAPLLVLKTRRIERRPISVRRTRLPAHSPDRALPSH